MPMRCILVPIVPGLSPTPCLDAALRMAEQAHAHLTVLYVRPESARLAGILPYLVDGAGLTVEAIERGGEQAAQKARAEFEAWCASKAVPTSAGHRIDATFALWREGIGDLAAHMVRLGRVNDLIVIDRRIRGTSLWSGDLDSAIFASGRPALVIGETGPANFRHHAVIAWNGSLEVVRVVAQCLGLLHEMEAVSIFTAPTPKVQAEPLADLQSYLRFHGIVAHPARPPPGPFESVGEALLATCHEARASLIMMGAFARSRVHESVSGGVTRHVLQHATIPVLLSY